MEVVVTAVYAAAAVWRALVATVDGGGPLVRAAQEFEWLWTVVVPEGGL